ncbi:glycosyltransferase [Candidatus Saccharibacteria bacterium]|nr:glycosyltransferase [Candidatus Saccharibacteria bacterium]
MGKTNDILLTAVITAHDEGLLAHKTMLSVFEGLQKVKDAGYKYEVIVHIDNGDETTKKYFQRYKDNGEVRIFENKFGDTGPSRNFSVKQANGKYVAFLDGDDLMSSNWFIKGIEILEQATAETIVHPEAVLTFGLDIKNNVLSIQKPSYDREKDTLILLGENRWCSVAMAKKETFEKFPYKRVGAGYGHEDYIFHVEASNAGINHAIAKETVLFYRRSDKSRLSSGVSSCVTIPYMDLFDFEAVKKLTKPVPKTTDERVKSRGYRLYKKIRNNNFLNFFITPVAKKTIKVLDKKQKKQTVPKFVKEEWININHIETQLYPHPWILRRVVFYDADKQTAVGRAYFEIAKQVHHKPNYVFIVPWLIRGGADKVLLNYIQALKEIYPDWKFTVIATVPTHNDWVDQLPEYVDFIDFGTVSESLPPVLQDMLFSRIITQLQCNKLHIINSEFGYDWARKHKDLVGAYYTLNVSLFCDEYIPGSNARGVFSYDDPYLLEILPVVNKVLVDNKTIVKKTCDHNGFNDDKFEINYQPIDQKEFSSPKEHKQKKQLKVLWASRIVPTKLPDLVAKIGTQINGKDIAIDAYGTFGQDMDTSVFNGISAIKYKGPYDGFQTIPTEKYDLFLYTAMSDGVPNVILEATAAGLPIIASNDGGVGEFVKDKKTGLLVKDYLKPDEYIEKMNYALNHQEELQQYVAAAQKLLLERHSWEKFVQTVKKDIG